MEGRGRLVRLLGCVKNYDWGPPGKESRVARLYACNSGYHVDQDKPYSEFWMGTHDSGPLYVLEGDGVAKSGLTNGGERKKLTLKNWIENNPSVLGEKVVNKWGTNLPFLFKVLSVAKALSIQAHPDKDLASRLHSELPHVYKDDNHKPEMALALTEFEALCGFISLEELKLIVQTVPEIVELVGTARAKQVLELIEDGGKEKGKLVLQSVFTELISASKDVVAEVIAKLISRLHVKNQSSRKRKAFLGLKMQGSRHD